ncbi:MAG: DNA polymerase III subunit beta [Clostridia bacterium]|nr:DNA polymerase III subunit beta [Clostridia bacterium]
MKIVFEKAKLLDAIAPALGVVSDRNTMTAIEGILVASAGSDKVEISAYDLEKGMKTSLEARVVDPGSCVINAGKLSRILRVMPDADITLEVNDRGVAKIHSGKSKFELHVLPAEDFPHLPELSGERGFTLPQAEFKKIISQISHAIAQNDQRPAINGAFITIKGSKMTAVATDGSRIALREKVCEFGNLNRSGEELDLEFIVPGKALGEVMKLLEGEGDVTIMLGRKHAIFVCGEVCFFTRMIDSEYINYERFIPTESKMSAVVDREKLISALECALLVTEDRTLGQAKSPVKLNFEDGSLSISSTSVSGSFADEIEIEKDGCDLLIGFNCRYLLDALRAAEGEKVKISGSTSLICVLIEAVEEKEEDRFLYLVLPVKM